jgi:cyclic pyranopterin phosphate synthase
VSLPVATGGPTPPAAGPLVDRFGRVHTYLRLSVTDRCNLRCTYCMPAEGLDWMPRDDLLTYEELVRVVRVLARLGVRKVRLTGGEPTVRRDLQALVAGLRAIPELGELAMTTNGLRLETLSAPLKAAGLTRVNVSLDDTDPERFAALTRGGDVHRVLRGIEAARAAGLTPVKINAVVVAGVNDDAPVRLVRHFAHAPDVEVRFIETMPFEQVDRTVRHVPAAVLRARITEQVSPLEPLPSGRHAGPATRFRLTTTGQVVGFVSPITEHFCEACNRLRLQADGHLRTCLSREAQPSLRDLLRAGVDDPGLERALRERLWGKIAGHEAHLEGSAFRTFDGDMTSIGG